ncbi:MAG TPA: hypothetical protein DCP92_18540 [Nitrospiraceae bacterium]|jgi:hypothetical protein|nr:hypothetical protein [Nitrospiraceae bacterium]
MEKNIFFLIFVVLGILVVIQASAPPAFAGRVVVWVGPGWGPWWGPAYYPYSYGPYYPYYSPPPYAAQQQSQVYVQQTQQPEEQSYWYFCTNPQGYYPYIKQCPKGWLKVVPPSAPDQGR